MTTHYKVGYLYQTSEDGQHWANGHGPIQHNLIITSEHDNRADALQAGAALIGSPSPMGVVTDAYLVARRGRTEQLLGEIREDGSLDRRYRRLPERVP